MVKQQQESTWHGCQAQLWACNRQHHAQCLGCWQVFTRLHPHLGVVLGGRGMGVRARGEGAGMGSSCPNRLRLPGPRDSLPGGPADCPSWAPELCPDPVLALLRKGDELTGVCASRDALCALMWSYEDALSPAEMTGPQPMVHLTQKQLSAFQCLSVRMHVGYWTRKLHMLVMRMTAYQCQRHLRRQEMRPVGAKGISCLDPNGLNLCQPPSPPHPAGDS